jgi:hypothetical protein
LTALIARKSALSAALVDISTPKHLVGVFGMCGGKEPFKLKDESRLGLTL